MKIDTKSCEDKYLVDFTAAAGGFKNNWACRPHIFYRKGITSEFIALFIIIIGTICDYFSHSNPVGMFIISL